MNILVGGLIGLSVTIVTLFNFAFTSAINREIMHYRGDIFYAVLILGIITNLFAALFFLSFFRASVTSPGRIPDFPPWNLVNPTEDLKAVEAKRGGGERFCRHEGKYKPDRCHHCSQCQACTLRMDHHCPWLDNCVGFWNYKFFVLTLSYAILTLLFITACCSWFGHFISNQHSPLGVEVARLVVGIVLASVSGIIAAVLCLFFAIHVTMMRKGVTTLEVFEKQRNEDFGNEESCLGPLCCEPKDPTTRKPINPSIYKLPSAIDNYKAALGEDVWWWWFPSVPSMKVGSADGLKFATFHNRSTRVIEQGDDSPLIERS